MINGIGPFRASQLIAKSVRPSIDSKTSGLINNVSIDFNAINKPIIVRNGYTDFIEKVVKNYYSKHSDKQKINHIL